MILLKEIISLKYFIYLLILTITFLQCADIPPKKKSDGYKNKSNSFGECPICWEALGKNPLASTKCGHVYCMKCIERSLQSEKKCPTCRSSLKGKAAYHPLYLSKN